MNEKLFSFPHEKAQRQGNMSLPLSDCGLCIRLISLGVQSSQVTKP